MSPTDRVRAVLLEEDNLEALDSMARSLNTSRKEVANEILHLYFRGDLIPNGKGETDETE